MVAKRIIKGICNVKLNTRKGAKRGRCGPSMKSTTCSVGNCSRWGWCGTTKLHSFKRSWSKKYDSSKARPACFAKISKKTIQVTIKAMNKGQKLVVKKAKKMLSKLKSKTILKKIIAKVPKKEK